MLSPVAISALLAFPASSAPRQRADAGNGAANVTYTGFRVLPDGRSLIYVELSGPVDVRVNLRGSQAVYTLEGAQVPLKNNKNPLITSGFASNVVSVKLVQHAAVKSKGKRTTDEAPPRVDVLIAMRAHATPTHTMVQSASGSVLEVTVPAAASGDP